MNEIDYGTYVNSVSGGLFISQKQGNTKLDLTISVWEAGGGTTPEEKSDYIKTEPSEAFNDDTPIAVKSARVVDANGTPVAGVQVTISNNEIKVKGADALQTIQWTVADGETFNRFRMNSDAGKFDVGRVDVDEGVGVTRAVGDKIFVDDDGPTITAQIADGTVAFATNATVSKSLNGAVGVDRVATDVSQSNTKTYTFTSWEDLAGFDEKVSTDATNATKVEYSKEGTLYYDIVLNQAGVGSYTFTVHKSAPPATTNFDFTDLPAGQNLFGVIAANKSKLDGEALLVIGSNVHLDNDGTYVTSGDLASDTVNTSKGGGPVTIGIGNQMFDQVNEGAFFVYLKDPDDDSVAGVPGGLTQGTADDADTIGFQGTTEATIGEVEIVQVQGGATAGMRITAYDINPGIVDTPESRAFAEDPVDPDQQVDIIGLRIFDKSGDLREEWANGQSNPDDPLVQVTVSGGSATISGFKAGYKIAFETEAPHDVALVQNTSGKWDVGGFNVSFEQITPDQVLDFSVKITDYDDDYFPRDPEDASIAGRASFSVGIDGTDPDNTVTFP